jgi:UDP-glucose 4-epimerase
MKKSILITGGLGFIGSHTAIELIQEGFDVVIVDNQVNSESFILDRIEQITGYLPVYYCLDVCDELAIEQIFENHQIDAVIHFAALKAVGESVEKPIKYFKNNINSLLSILSVMEMFNCSSIVFSSSATVYGDADKFPIDETFLFKKSLSAYGSTKQFGEDILEKVSKSSTIKSMALRYFNPVGAHPSGLLGELPIGKPNNLMPYLTQFAANKLENFTVYGNDYSTKDGTCLRDYIHVVDLAKAHVKSCIYLLENSNVKSFDAINIGTGKANSVFELIAKFEEVNYVKLNYKIGNRRLGDAEVIYGSVDKAYNVLNWKAELTLNDMVRDAWNWQLNIS